MEDNFFFDNYVRDVPGRPDMFFSYCPEAIQAPEIYAYCIQYTVYGQPFGGWQASDIICGWRIKFVKPNIDIL
jgi:hypothetical protein